MLLVKKPLKTILQDNYGTSNIIKRLNRCWREHPRRKSQGCWQRFGQHLWCFSEAIWFKIVKKRSIYFKWGLWNNPFSCGLQADTSCVSLVVSSTAAEISCPCWQPGFQRPERNFFEVKPMGCILSVERWRPNTWFSTPLFLLSGRW